MRPGKTEAMLRHVLMAAQREPKRFLIVGTDWNHAMVLKRSLLEMARDEHAHTRVMSLRTLDIGRSTIRFTTASEPHVGSGADHILYDHRVMEAKLEDTGRAVHAALKQGI